MFNFIDNGSDVATINLLAEKSDMPEELVKSIDKTKLTLITTTDKRGKQIKRWVNKQPDDKKDRVAKKQDPAPDSHSKTDVKKQPTVKYYKPSSQAKAKMNELSKTLGNKQLLDLAVSRGIQWDVHEGNKGINLMRAKMAIGKAIDGGVWDTPAEDNSDKTIAKDLHHLRELLQDDNTDLGTIDTSKITDMHDLFTNSKRTSYKGIETWDVSNVTDMHTMFADCDLDGKDVDISKWDVSKVTDMYEMFRNTKFNGDISKWNVSNVKDMSNMFIHSSFNGDISKWDVSKVENMKYMFNYSEFNGDISNWDVSNVDNMHEMFAESKFNGDLSKWDVSNVKSMTGMFYKTPFNGDISKWNVSNVIDMGGMFSRSEFNGDISNWDVSNVDNMTGMFQSSKFTGDISKWKLSDKQMKGIGIKQD